VKYNDEQLSAILSAHCTGDVLLRGGTWEYDPYIRCINQVAFNSPSVDPIEERFLPAQIWFDDYYDFEWSPDRFLKELEAKGLA